MAIRVQWRLAVEIPISNQTQTKLAISSRAMATNQPGLIFDSSWDEPNTLMIDGQTK